MFTNEAKIDAAEKMYTGRWVAEVRRCDANEVQEVNRKVLIQLEQTLRSTHTHLPAWALDSAVEELWDNFTPLCKAGDLVAQLVNHKGEGEELVLATSVAHLPTFISKAHCYPR